MGEKNTNIQQAIEQNYIDMTVLIVDKQACCGCQACRLVCPRNCITMVADEEGFWYPDVKESHCIHCGKCKRVCPHMNKTIERKPQCIYAAKHENEQIRLKSSSGGIFSIFAEHTINMGGVVFGARFNEKWEVIHDYTEDIDGLEKFRGSKYVQSDIRETFVQTESFLKDGREVLFSGTPCQIKALNLFLGKKYSNLFTVEVVCHSVPSPKVWQKYVREKAEDMSSYSETADDNNEHDTSLARIKDILFRDKENGWKEYSISFLCSNKQEKYSSLHFNDPYFKLFASDLITRPSCSNCSAKSGKSGADVAIADYWWINALHHDYDDGKGVSLIYSYSEKSQEWVNKLIKDKKETFTSRDIEEAYLYEGAWSNSTKWNPRRKECFVLLRTHRIADAEVQRLATPIFSFWKWVVQILKRILKLIGIFKTIKRLYKKIAR